MSTSLLTAAPPTTRSHRRVPLGAAVVVVVLAGALAAWMLAPLLMAPPWRMVGWQLLGYPGRVSDTSPTVTAVSVYVARWPTEYDPKDDSWLDQGVIETPWTVTIVLHTSDAFGSGPALRSWFDTGGWVTVHLRAPLGGRMLFDGSGIPPQPRW